MTEQPIKQMTPAELEAEQRGARRAGALALLSGFLMLGALLLTASTSPKSGSDEREALIRSNDHATELIVSQALSALSFILLAVVLTFLFKAVMARSADAPAVGRSAAISGPVLVGLLGLATQIVVVSIAGDFVDDPVRTLEAAKDKIDSGLIEALQIAEFASKLLLGVGVLLTSLHAMRTGLLMKGQGIIGIALAVFIAVIGPFPLPQALWLGWIGTTLMAAGDRRLPAWGKGRAVPWPNARELRRELEEDQEVAQKSADEDAQDEPAGPADRRA